MAKGRKELDGKQKKRGKCGPQIGKEHGQILSVSIFYMYMDKRAVRGWRAGTREKMRRSEMITIAHRKENIFKPYISNLIE